MEYKAISFRTFQKYCNERYFSTNPNIHGRLMCGKTFYRKVHSLECNKKNCPVFKRLKTSHKDIRRWPHEHER
jgi:hypothetical protein